MGYRLARAALVLAFSVAGFAGLAFLLTHDPVPDLALSVPGMDGKPAGPPAGAASVKIGERFRAFDGSP
jgi:hypothetical protein